MSGDSPVGTWESRGLAASHAADNREPGRRVGTRRPSSVSVAYPPAMRLVLDWDGTCTATDGLVLAVERYGDPRVYEEAELSIGRRLTLHEVIGLELETVTAPLEEVVAFLVETLPMRPGFRELVEAHRPLVLSSGFRELIDPLLAREGVEVEVEANRLAARPDGWLPLWRDNNVCAECGEACKRATLPPGEIVFVGDGYSDLCAAKAAVRVFARDRLCGYLDAAGVPWEPFDDLFDVLRALG